MSHGTLHEVDELPDGVSAECPQPALIQRRHDLGEDVLLVCVGKLKGAKHPLSDLPDVGDEGVPRGGVSATTAPDEVEIQECQRVALSVDEMSRQESWRSPVYQM